MACTGICRSHAPSRPLLLLTYLALATLIYLAAPPALADSGMCTAPPEEGDAADTGCSGGSEDGAHAAHAASSPSNQPPSFLIDITATISKYMPLWDSQVGVGCFARVLHKDMDKGDPCYASYIGISAHTGTHIDMPSHFLPEEYKSGNTVEKVDLDMLMGPVAVMEVPAGSNITAEVIRDLSIPSTVERLIFKTDSTTKGLMEHTPFHSSYTGLTPDGAAYLVQHHPHIKTLGIDYLSIASYDTCAETHVVLFKKHIMVIEGLLLGDVDPGWYTLTCLPLKISGSEGAPARCILTAAPPQYYEAQGSLGDSYGQEDDDLSDYL